MLHNKNIVCALKISSNLLHHHSTPSDGLGVANICACARWSRMYWRTQTPAEEEQEKNYVWDIHCSYPANAGATSLRGDAGRPPLLSGQRDGLGVRVSDLLASPAAPAADRLLREPFLHVVSVPLAPDVVLVSALQADRLQEHPRQED